MESQNKRYGFAKESHLWDFLLRHTASILFAKKVLNDIPMKIKNIINDI